MADQRRWGRRRAPVGRRIVPAIGILVSVLTASLGGCRFPGATDPQNLTNAVLAITSINDGNVLRSDVVTKGQATDDIIEVEFKSSVLTLGDEDATDWNGTDIGGESPLDDITLSRYRVVYSRSDSGPVPTEFTLGVHILIPAKSDQVTQIVIVRGFAKSYTPLRELWELGELTLTATITFYGEDGYGNDVVISGALPVCFGNYPDE